MQPSITHLLQKCYYQSFIGFFACSLGVTFISLQDSLPKFIFTSLFVLKPNSPIVNMWMKMPVTLANDFYYYNWSNPEDFYNHSVKLKLKETGPYRFLQNMEKLNVIWNENDTVTYNQMRYWHFSKDGSIGDLTDNITTINTLPVGAAHLIRNWNFYIKRAASVVLSTLAPKLHVTRTIDELLYNGFDDNVMELAHVLPFIAAGVPRLEKFSWLRLFNASPSFEGVYNMRTGVGGNYDMLEWNYENNSYAFNGSCAKVHGSGGELYSRTISKDHIGIFSSHVCRYIRFDFEEEVNVEGIMGYKFSIGDGLLDNGTKIPGNDCYCTGDCVPYGLINISSCRYDTPLFLSLPNFYKADPVYRERIEGLVPNKSKHETYIIIEPTTGLPLEVVIRVQLVGLIHPVEGLRMFENVPRIFYPLFWLEQRAELPKYIIVLLKIYLYAPYILIGLGTILVIVGLYLLYSMACRPMFSPFCKKIRHKKHLLKLKDSQHVQISREKHETNLLLQSID